MDSNERRIRILDELAETLGKVGPVILTPEYMEAIQYIEALPQNQSGADKSWVHRVMGQSRFHARTIHRIEDNCGL